MRDILKGACYGVLITLLAITLLETVADYYNYLWWDHRGTFWGLIFGG